jgi:arsenate reductase-like glutaredoxin family protein
MSEVIIYHNPACGTSRNVLGLIRDAPLGARLCRPPETVLEILPRP